jgi:hypothetical protein
MGSHDSDKNLLSEEKSTPQQEANFRYFVRVNRLFYVVVLAAGTVFVIFRPTAPRVAGLVIIAVITASSFFLGRVSLRVYGFSFLALASVLLIVAKLAGSGWPMDSHEFEIMAISSSVIGLGLVFTSNRTGEPNPRFEEAAGVMAMIWLAGITAFVIWRGGSIGVWISAEAAAALADSANKKWKTRLSVVALLPIAALTVSFLQLGWKPQYNSSIHHAFSFFVSHNHTWMIFPVISAFGATCLGAINAKVSRRAAVRFGLLFAGAIWLVLFLVDASE